MPDYLIVILVIIGVITLLLLYAHALNRSTNDRRPKYAIRKRPYLQPKKGQVLMKKRTGC